MRRNALRLLRPTCYNLRACINMTMRIRYCALAFLLVTGSSNAFARGGAGGALGAMLEELLIFAIVGGLCLGAVCADFRWRWKGVAILLAGALAVSVVFPFAGFFLGIPSAVLLAVAAAASYLVRGGIFRARPVGPSPASMDGKPQESGPAGASSILRWVSATYLFWAAVSLVNFELLGFLAVPPLVFFFPAAIGKFLPFILPPLAVALAFGVIATAFVSKRSRALRHAAPFIFNACVLLAFLVSAEVYRHHLMAQSLLDHKPDHLYSSPFLNSVITYRAYFRGPHASFEENGKTYLWSYSECRFFQVP